MPDERWNVVPESDVIPLAGPGAQIYRMPFVTYVLGPAAFIFIVEPGDRPGGTAVQDREYVYLAGPFPDEVNAYLYKDVAWWDPPARSAPQGFVRVREGCLPLGP